MKHLRWTIVFLVGSLAFWNLGCPEDPDDPDPTDYEVELAGENQVPSIATPATGTMDVNLDQNNVLTVEGDFTGLVSQLRDIQGSPAHIHVGEAGENGPVVFTVNVDADDDQRSGTFTLTETLTADQVQVFENNEYYLNIHTNAYPEGELRAQLDPDAPEFAGIDESWGVEMTAEAQPHDVDTDGEGWVWAILRDDNSFVASGAVQNLSSDITDIRLERGEAGEVGDTIFTMDFEERDDDVTRFWFNTELTDGQVTDLRDDLFYVTVITEDEPDGELRAQFDDDDNFFENIWENIFGDSPNEIDEAPPF